MYCTLQGPVIPWSIRLSSTKLCKNELSQKAGDSKPNVVPNNSPKSEGVIDNEPIGSEVGRSCIVGASLKVHAHSVTLLSLRYSSYVAAGCCSISRRLDKLDARVRRPSSEFQSFMRWLAVWSQTLDMSSAWTPRDFKRTEEWRSSTSFQKPYIWPWLLGLSGIQPGKWPRRIYINLSSTQRLTKANALVS